MPQSLSRILIHLVFSTKNRMPIINKEIEHQLHAYFTGILKNLKCPSLQAGGTEDHVHYQGRLPLAIESCTFGAHESSVLNTFTFRHTVMN